MQEQPKDRDREMRVAQLIGKAWKMEPQRMGPYSPYDIYFVREKKLVAIAEIKVRTNRERDSYKTAFMNLDKFFVLLNCELALGKPAVFVLAFTDGIYFVRVGSLAVREYAIGFRGRTDRPGVANDIRPVIEIPSERFVKVCSSEGVL